MRQKAGEVEAAGKVASTREPEKKKTKDTGLMSGEEPIQARAAKMLSTEDNSIIVYEGDALLWQGSNRITANRIRIERKTGRLHATGNVVTQLLDKSDAKKTQSVFTVVRSPEFTYDDKARLAHYTGGASMNRAGTVVTAKEIRAWLTPDTAASSVVLTGGQPVFADTMKGTTKGDRITYISDGDKLLVEGESKRPVESKVLRK
jgi:lipopolysaccharide export system protein LptA